jgi:hypothetical protein
MANNKISISFSLLVLLIMSLMILSGNTQNSIHPRSHLEKYA